jgi:hypothetical protein
LTEAKGLQRHEVGAQTLAIGACGVCIMDVCNCMCICEYV